MYVILYLFCVVLIVYALFIGYNLQIFKPNTMLKTDKLLEFSTNIEFTQTTEVAIENQYNCNARDLHTCDINDPTTLFGCKELTVRCQHFEKDIEFKENGNTYIIKKNKTKTEGYALAITNLAKTCNPYHGDLVLVTANTESTDYMLICSCKHPGYIGNLSLLNSCEDVFVCNGKIDNINKPLEEINCICEKTEHTVRYNDGLPTCKTLLVKEANELYDDWSNLINWNSDRKITSKIFNNTIQQNLKSSVLLNPCTNSAHDTSIAIPNSSYSPLTKSCVYRQYGLPIQNGLLANVPDYLRIDGALATGEYIALRMSGNVAGVERFGAVKATMDFYDGKTSTMVLPKNICFGDNMNINMNNIKPSDSIIAPRCIEGQFFNWNCYIKSRYSWLVNNIPRTNFYELPALWSQRPLWNAAESCFNNSFLSTKYGIGIDQKKLNDLDGVGFTTNGYGLQYHSSYGKSGLLSFPNDADAHAHKSVIT